MIVKVEKDITKIYLFMTEPEIWERIKQDGDELNEFYPRSGFYYTVEHNDEVIAMTAFNIKREGLAAIHPMVLKDYRKHSKEIIRMTINKFREDVGNVEIIGEFPSCFRDIRLALKKCGFTKVGEIKNGTTKFGEKCGLVIAQYGE